MENKSSALKPIGITLGVIGGVIGIIVGIVGLPWILIAAGIILSPAPPAPEIKYGEFPFEIVYEIDGEVVTVNDVYVCKYAGIGANEGVGKYRKWKGYIKSSKEHAIFLTEDNDREVYCSVGSAEYYMDDEKYPLETPLAPHVYDIPKKALDYEIYTSDEVLEHYNIKIISWKFSDPIENSFK